MPRALPARQKNHPVALVLAEVGAWQREAPVHRNLLTSSDLLVYAIRQWTDMMGRASCLATIDILTDSMSKVWPK